ncbi:hypothetical protein FQN54_000714 [Arachnomyces sp. PD_36]|nr:hypothetical protein FQN54_000714 [Arachnomyces sp. PD_36]
MKFSTFVLALASAATAVQAAAISESEDAAIAERTLQKRGCQITLCKGIGKTDCSPPFDPEFDCTATDGAGYVSGYASPGCRCEVYEKADCSYFWEGQWEYVDETGWSDWHFPAAAVRCQ